MNSMRQSDTFQLEENRFSKNAKNTAMTMHEALL